MTSRAEAERFAGIQVLRFVAALLVVVCHSTLGVSERMAYLGTGVWEKGGIGVSIFFVISGFVIVMSSRSLQGRTDGWREFARRRLIRIVPLYWAATTLKLTAVLLRPQVTLHSALSWPHVIFSYLFLPSRNPLGVVTPLHAVGWTLNYEMLFYAAYTTALALKAPPLKFIIALFGCLIAWGLFDPMFSRAWSALVYTSPMVLEFLLGMLIAAMVERGIRLPPVVGLASLAVGGALIAHFDVLTGWPAFFCHGIPSALIVLGVVHLEPWLAGHWLRVPISLGEASYALYLFHPFVVAGCAIALSRLEVGSSVVAVAVMTSLAVAASVVIHVGFELPVTNALKRATRLRPSVLVPQPSIRP
jgi:peptidoglycan/LPS O-acetylase OafA/YrhL